MFIGHFGIALAAKRVAPRTSLGTLIFAAQFVDLLWPIFLLLGNEHVEIVPGAMKMSPFEFTDYPISHSLLMVLVWSGLVGGAYYAIQRYRRGAWVVAGCVASHWVLDYLVHKPDLLLWPGGSAKFGLGLWNRPGVAIPLELLVFAFGVWTYLSCTRPRDNAGNYGFWSLIVLLLVGWVATLFAGTPPSVTALAWGGMTMWLTVPWAGWADSRRSPRT